MNVMPEFAEFLNTQHQLIRIRAAAVVSVLELPGRDGEQPACRIIYGAGEAAFVFGAFDDVCFGLGITSVHSFIPGNTES